MNTNEIFWQLLRSGFPLLIMVVYGMLLASVWRNQKFSQEAKWKWSAIICLPGILSVALLWFTISTSTEELILPNWVVLVSVFVPFSGVLAWLVATR